MAALLLCGTGAADAGTAGFTDGADDAYRLPGTQGAPPATQPAMPTLSDAEADILSASLATLKQTRRGGTYSVSMRLAAVPDPSYSYVVAGEFGGDCQLYHPLTPRHTYAVANAFCGSGDTRRFIGAIGGSRISTRGTELTATFTFAYRDLPAELRADPELGPLFAYTCVSGLEGRGCRPSEVLDVASDPLGTFTL